MAPSTLPCTAEGGPRETRRESHRLRIEPCPQSCQCRCPQSCPRRRAPPRAGFARRVIEKRGSGPPGPGRSFSRGWSARTRRRKSEGGPLVHVDQEGGRQTPAALIPAALHRLAGERHPHSAWKRELRQAPAALKALRPTTLLVGNVLLGVDSQRPVRIHANDPSETRHVCHVAERAAKRGIGSSAMPACWALETRRCHGTDLLARRCDGTLSPRPVRHSGNHGIPALSDQDPKVLKLCAMTPTKPVRTSKGGRALGGSLAWREEVFPVRG